MNKEVFTIMNTPFAFGGTSAYIKTTIEKYERVDIGKGYYGILFFNPIRKLYHLAIEEGAIIGTDQSKSNLLKMVRKDVETGDDQLMKEQIKQSKSLCKRATEMEVNTFFSRFASRGKK